MIMLNCSGVVWNFSGCGLILLFLSNMWSSPFLVYLCHTRIKYVLKLLCAKYSVVKNCITVLCLSAKGLDRCHHKVCQIHKHLVYLVQNLVIWLCLQFQMIAHDSLFYCNKNDIIKGTDLKKRKAHITYKYIVITSENCELPYFGSCYSNI